LDGHLKLVPSDRRYPRLLNEVHRNEAPPELTYLGNLELLSRPGLAVIGSVRCPAGLILRAQDLAGVLKDANFNILGGFHSPVEREMVTVLLRGSVGLTVGIARGLASMRLPKQYWKPLADGKLLLLSLSQSDRRITRRLAWKRTRLLALLADLVLVVHAAHGSDTSDLCEFLLSVGKKVVGFEHPANKHLAQYGVTLVEGSAIRGHIQGTTAQP
jgi:predicted Rossmann fold nucleotide-binding protein DprA/Smf involved in DNA uptake